MHSLGEPLPKLQIQIFSQCQTPNPYARYAEVALRQLAETCVEILPNTRAVSWKISDGKITISRHNLKRDQMCTESQVFDLPPGQGPAEPLHGYVEFMPLTAHNWSRFWDRTRAVIRDGIWHRVYHCPTPHDLPLPISVGPERVSVGPKWVSVGGGGLQLVCHLIDMLRLECMEQCWSRKSNSPSDVTARQLTD